MGILIKSTKWLFILCLPLLLLSASLGWAVNSHWLYKAGFEKYNISQRTGLARSELDKVATGLISYFNSDGEYISLTVIKDDQPFELFNEKEVIHLKDVKGLIWLDYWVLLVTLIYALTYTVVSLFWRNGKYRRRLAKGVLWGSGITLGLMLALGLGTLLNFKWLFLGFHLISFTNELWLLDPTKDYLIMLFPQGFFYDTAILCAGVTAGLALILGGVSVGYLRFSRRGATP